MYHRKKTRLKVKPQQQITWSVAASSRRPRNFVLKPLGLVARGKWFNKSVIKLYELLRIELEQSSLADALHCPGVD